MVGNPNAGKSTLFNALTGYHRHSANYPGVTVDVGRGLLRGSSRPVELLDVPGTYSLAAASPDEMLVCDLLHGRMTGQAPPDAIVAVLDASNLPRNLYLLSQLLELGLPLVAALNMSDLAQKRGITIDAKRLAERLGVAVVPIVATDESTLPPLVRAIERVLSAAASPVRADLPEVLRAESRRLSNEGGSGLSDSECLRALLDRDGATPQLFIRRGGNPALLQAARERLAAAEVDGAPAEIRARYAWIHKLIAEVVQRTAVTRGAWSTRVDRWLTHRLFGAAFLFVVLAVLFQSIFAWADPLMSLIDEQLIGSFRQVARSALGDGMLGSLAADGIIAGVGGVLVFLPQIVILFALIAILEDCGYMARAAFMMDRLMGLLGLSGRAFIPLLSSFACAVPAIMGTRVIADRRERFITILLAPFMSCSARLPVYVLMIGAFVPPAEYLGGLVTLPGLVMLGMYAVGVLVAIPVAWLLRNTALRGGSSAFLLELPAYKLPRLRAIWQRVYFAARGFVVRAGTVIFAASVLIWALGYFPRSAAVEEAARAAAMADGAAAEDAEKLVAGALLRASALGRIGRLIEPAVAPLGWDWRIGIAAVASFPAREVVVATLGIVFNLGDEEDEESPALRTALAGARNEATGGPLFTLPVALSLMVFFALCAQCASTLAVIARETRSWIWPVVSFVGMTAVAYAAAFLTVVAARALGA
ncbi:MAG: ferrous iron transport protein B [Planctomycetia bacterium]|nr:MAG: ferrous iron transport protein B [Planctomycetia bacterium]